MKNKPWKAVIIFILLTESVGALSAFLTRNGIKNFETIKKSSLTPTAVVFPIVWTLLFALMGIGAAIIWESQSSSARKRALAVFFAQLTVNFFWSVFFFNLEMYGFSFVWILLLWVLIAVMILTFATVNKTAARLQIPYFIWVTFAAYLNFAVWQLNK